MQVNPVVMNENSRVDMHVHSTASELSKLGIQRSLNLPECATEPWEVYELAKRQGMDFVTITDHDTIDGRARDRPPAGHVHLRGADRLLQGRAARRCTSSATGSPPSDHEWLQAHNDDVETCAAYLQEHEITAALAHPFYAVQAPLTARHRRRLAQLFPIWETRNGSRAKELNLPAFVYIETHGGTAIGGSDDHAGIDIGRTFTQTPPAAGPREFLDHVRAGPRRGPRRPGLGRQVDPRGDGAGDPQLRRRRRARAPPDPSAVLAIVERVMREGDARHGQVGSDLGPEDARALLRAWLAAMDLGARRDTAARAPAGRHAQPSRPAAPRAAHPRAPARRRGLAIS